MKAGISVNFYLKTILIKLKKNIPIAFDRGERNQNYFVLWARLSCGLGVLWVG